MTVTACDPDAPALLGAARALPVKRLSQLHLDGKVYFIKMAERHASLRWRLQKGDPQAAFQREKALLAAFSARGASVAEIVAQDADRIILADHGRPLHVLLPKQDDPMRILHAAGTALADLHARGLAHGRPSLRDICWDGARITFLDLEAGARLQAQPRHKARDLFLLLHSAMRLEATVPGAAALILRAYRAHGDVSAVKALARKLWWLDLLAGPVIRWHDWRGKVQSEFRALRQTRRLILRQG